MPIYDEFFATIKELYVSFVPAHIISLHSVYSVTCHDEEDEERRNANNIKSWLGNRASKPSQLDADMTKMMKSNVTGNILLFNVFLPLILKGEAKKVITITSGMSDIDLINKAEVSESPIYAMTKAAMNVVTAKFNLEYKDQGVLFIGICPGIMQGDGNDPSRRTCIPYTCFSLLKTYIHIPHLSLSCHVTLDLHFNQVATPTPVYSKEES